MKILIGYDGSDYADAALLDLKLAGLPQDAEATILTATETWLPARDDLYTEDSSDDPKWTWRETALKKVAECENLAVEASRKIKEMFPAWQIGQRIVGGYPEWAVVVESKKIKPDLIVVGSQGRGSIGRIILGSVSLKVLSEADCSVRVARQSPFRAADDNSPPRIIVGIDGSPDSHLAVEKIAKRFWSPETEIRLVTAIDRMIDLDSLNNLPFNSEEIEKAGKLRQFAVEYLEQKGLRVSTVIKEGRAKKLLVEEAEGWKADAIFIGAKGHRLLERILLGSVSYAVTARAHCTVEVIRSQTQKEK